MSEDEEYIDAPLIKPNKVIQRLYQMVLAGKTIQNNTLVVLPTGLGKTVVAILAAAFFLNKHKSSKFIFTAPTRPLVDQHVKSLKIMLDIPEWEITQLSGSIPAAKRAEVWRRNRAIVATPQVVRNDIINGTLNLKQVSFLCIDECHRMVGNDATVLIGEQYLQQNPDGRLVGITASPGRSEKMLEIMKNLGAKSVEYRDENDPDVKLYVFSRNEEVVTVDLPESFKEIIVTLDKLLEDDLKVLKKGGIIKSFRKSQVRRTELIRSMGELSKKKDEFDSPDEFFKLINANSDALRLSHALEQLETQGIPSLYEYLKKQKNLVERDGKKSVMRFLRRAGMGSVYEDTEQLYNSGVIHPKIKELLKIVSSEFEREVSSKILIFANFRNTVKLLSDALNSLDGVNSHWFVGQSSSEEDIGLKQRDQLRILDEFKDGKYNVLVSTSVGEEGLDIAQCDVVIFYDIAASATRLIQRSGRTGRKREGRVIMLIAKGTRDEGYYYASRANRKRLRLAIEEVKEKLEEFKVGQTSLDDFYSESEKNVTKDSVIDTVITQKDEEQREDLSEEKILPDERIEDIPTLSVDHREKANSIIRLLMSRNDIRVEAKHLPVGDYMVSDRVGIERKSTSDFVSTLVRGDLIPQIIQLKDAFTHPLLLIEGEDLYNHSLHANSIRGMISSILVDFRVPIIFTKDESETAEYLAYLSYKEQIKKKRPSQVKTQRYHDSLAEEQISLISQLPKINRQRAEDLLKKFGSPRNIFNSTQDELIETPRIGKVIANRIDLLLNTPYEESKDS